MRVNENRRARRLSPGDVVFWQLPHRARTDKHFFPEPSNGPYIVTRQPTKFSVVLKSAKTGKEINESRLIPLDQIIVGSVATQLAFNNEANEVRTMSEMLSGGANPIDPAGDTDQVIGAGRHRGGKPRLVGAGKRKAGSTCIGEPSLPTVSLLQDHKLRS